MIYASTKSQLKLEFGASYIKEEYNATQDDEMSLSGYLKNKAFMAAPTPLTQREEELKELRRAEVKADVSVQSRAQMSSGINCPVSENAMRALKDMKDGKFNYLQFEIDLEKEQINISKTANINVNELKSQLPTDHARFHIFLFKHSFESDYQESFVFIYSMPGYKCSVKERMMYSSCKAPFVDTIQSGTMGIDIAKKIEIDDPEELSEENLLDELHPKKLLHKQQFAKPAPPSKNRGPRRIIK
jgi:twinfilin